MIDSYDGAKNLIQFLIDLLQNHACNSGHNFGPSA